MRHFQILTNLVHEPIHKRHRILCRYSSVIIDKLLVEHLLIWKGKRFREVRDFVNESYIIYPLLHY